MNKNTFKQGYYWIIVSSSEAPVIGYWNKHFWAFSGPYGAGSHTNEGIRVVGKVSESVVIASLRWVALGMSLVAFALSLYDILHKR